MCVLYAVCCVPQTMQCAIQRSALWRNTVTNGVTLFRFSPHPTRTGMGEWEREEGGTEDWEFQIALLQCFNWKHPTPERLCRGAGMEDDDDDSSRVSFFERRKAADRSSTKCTQNTAASLPSVPALYFEVEWSWLWFPACKPRALFETSQNCAPSTESYAGFWITKHRCIHSRSLSNSTLISLCCWKNIFKQP